MTAVSCGSEDDICLGGEATPRLKVKFREKATGKPRTLDSVFIKADYGKGPVEVISRVVRTDSVLIPLRVDNAETTRFYIGLSRAAVTSEIDMHYTTRAEYVSPACGVRKIYENVRADLVQPLPVSALELSQTQITDETRTHLYLLF